MTEATRAHAAHNFKLTSKSLQSGQMFVSPEPAGRRITAGFTWIQRIGKSASVDVWFPDCLKREMQDLIASGQTPHKDAFPAEWAAVRQFELLQEAGNYKIYDLDPTRLMRTLNDLTKSMRGGGYRVTVATIGSYVEPGYNDELQILDRHLQERISSFINMMYLEEQSGKMNNEIDAALRNEKWDYLTALPHIGATLGARDLFRPSHNTRTITVKGEAHLVPAVPNEITVANGVHWLDDLGVADAITGRKLSRVKANPLPGQYAAEAGVYHFNAADAWREVLISYRYGVGEPLSGTDRKHRLSQYFFKILGMLPQNHIVHDTAIGLQLPESINENQWIYIAQDGEKIGDFVRLMDNLFAPFNKISMSELDGRADAKPEIKAVVGHMTGYGDRLRPDSDQFYRSLAAYTAS
jgi:hypothetical protein